MRIIAECGQRALVEDMDVTPSRISAPDIGLEVGKVQKRSGSSSRILGISAEMNAETRGFSRRTRGGRTAARNADNTVLFAEKVQGLDGLLGQTDDAAGREVGQWG